jgi:uncharacterized membrane protein
LLRPLHPVHAIFLAGALPLYLGALLGDLAYASSYETQWKNFASWLVIGGLVLNAGVAVWAIVDFVRLGDDRGARRGVYLAATVISAVLGFVNALVHAGDAWQSMPAGAVLSALVVILSITAIWIGFSNYRVTVRA